MVTTPFLWLCRYCRWLPRVRSRYHPSSSIILIIARTFTAADRDNSTPSGQTRDLSKSVNGADGISEIEGKVARVCGEGVGKRPSFKSVAKNAAGKVVAAGHRNQHARRTRSPDTENRFIIRVHSWLRLLREALNEGTLRAFRYADRFTTFKIFRRPGALRRRVAPGQSRRSDRVRSWLI